MSASPLASPARARASMHQIRRPVSETDNPCWREPAIDRRALPKALAGSVCGRFARPHRVPDLTSRHE